MEINFEQLKKQMDEMLSEYKRALNNGDYAKAKDITVAVLQLFRDTYKVQLDTNPEFDHIFHEVMTKMQTELRNSRPTTEEATDHEVEIINMFSAVADGVFKVSDIRRRAMEMEPSADELIASLEEGIQDADDQSRRLKNLREQYARVYNNIYGADKPNLRDKINDEKFYVGTLDLINEQIDRLDQLKRSIDTMEAEIAADPSKEAMYRDKIDANQSEMAGLLSDMSLKMTAMQEKGLDITDIEDAKSDDNAKRLATQAKITALRDKIDNDLTNDYTTLINNINKTKAKFGHIEEIANIDLTGVDPSIKEGREEIDKSLEPFMELFDRIKVGQKLQTNRRKAFRQSIQEIREEQKILGIDTSDMDRYRNGLTDEARRKIEEEKAYYRQDMKDKLYGNPEKAEKWKEYYKLFIAARKVVPYTFVDEAGNSHDSEYITIDYDKFTADLSRLSPPVTLQDALKLLQLEEYKERMERVSKFKQGDRSVLKELPSYKKYEAALEAERNATTPGEKERAARQKSEAINALNEELKEDQIYVATNHGATNNNELIAKAIGDAGSLVKYKRGRMAYREQEGIWGKVKAFGHNYASLVGLRSIKDAKTLPGKIGTAVLDTTLAVVSPISAVTKVIYRYTPVVGKQAQAKRYIKKHAGENSSPYEGRKDARKMKRRKEYSAKMKGPFKNVRAWIKASNDELFFHGRAAQTEEDFCNRELEERVYPSIENRYLYGAQAADVRKQEMAKENLEKRKRDARNIASRDYPYNDLIRDPEAAESDEFEKQAILGASLEENGQDSEGLRYSKTDRPRDRRFVKDNEPLTGTLHRGLRADVIDYSNPVGSVVQSDAVDRATRQEGVGATYTARNYIPYTITGIAVSMAARLGLSKLKTVVEQVIPGTPTHQQVRVKRFAGYEQYDKTIKVPHKTTQVDTSGISRTPAQFAAANNGKTVHLYETAWGGKHGGYDIDISGHDNLVGVYAEVPRNGGGIERIALAVPENAGQYDYLGQLADQSGLSASRLAKYIDPATGTFRPNADYYDLIAEVANARGATTGLTGNQVAEMAFKGTSGTKIFLEPVDGIGSYYGGWIDVTDLGQQLGVTDVITYTAKKVVRTRPKWVWDVVDKTIPAPDTVVQVEDATLGTVGAAYADAAAIGHVVEATDKAIGSAIPENDERARSKRMKKQDRPDQVEPGRSHKFEDFGDR